MPSFFIESFRIPPFLLPIYQAAGTAYGIPWQVLAAINEVETDYGRDLSVSSAGAEGWMQFLPPEWAQYGVDANGDGFKDPYNPADAIFAAARYLRAAGGSTNIKAAVYSYNHSQSYVELGDAARAAARRHAAAAARGDHRAHRSALPGARRRRTSATASRAAPASGPGPAQTLVGTTIYSQAGAPVIAVQDGKIVQIGDSPSLGRFVSLRDAYGNTYTYAQLGEVAPLYPVLVPHDHTRGERADRTAGRGGRTGSERSGHGGGAAAFADVRRRHRVGARAGRRGGTGIGTRHAASAARPGAAAGPPPAPKPADARVFREGPDDVYLHPLRAGVEVIAGTVLGHLGERRERRGRGGPHMLFRDPPGRGAGAADRSEADPRRLGGA